MNLEDKIREHEYYELEYESMRYISLHVCGTTNNLVWLKFRDRWGRRRVTGQDEAEKAIVRSQETLHTRLRVWTSPSQVKGQEEVDNKS